MTREPDSCITPVVPADDATIREILGYLNFSSGKPDAGFQRNLNRLFVNTNVVRSAETLRDFLLGHLSELRKSSGTFADSAQAEAVIRLALDRCLPAYRQHHADLLFHLSAEGFLQPFFLARVFEAVLEQGGPWDADSRIVLGVLDRLNDFLGHRPLAILEDGRNLREYPHERFRPVPLVLRDAGVAVGKYRELIARTLQFLKETPPDLLSESHFELAQLDELALDVRAHDHLHPMNKRTNYMFGEWDPHLIDNSGRYRRFVLRQIVLDSLLDWLEENSQLDPEERLHDAAAVLCGTILMASSIGGSGPDTHQSGVTLTSLLPKVARQRDAFYAGLLERTSGERAARLQREAKRTQQPFGHIRQHLNMALARYGARQVQYRHLAELFARMGYFTAAREQAGMIPSVSARFESEIRCRISAAHLMLDASDLNGARVLIVQIEDLLHRGIECGALIDPWNILGFQGQFPLFASQQDAIPDERAETLLDAMEAIFSVYARALGEAAAQGAKTVEAELSAAYRQLADWWDKFAAKAIVDLPVVDGGESWEAATHASHALAEWRAAGEAAGDISFWRQHVDEFESAKAYALVVEPLLQKRDYVAAMALLMQWLSRGDEVRLEAGGYSFHELVLVWMSLVIDSADSDEALLKAWPLIKRFFEYLEANGEDFWHIPDFATGTGIPLDAQDGLIAPSDELFDEHDAELDEDDEDAIFGAAYDDVIYVDSAQDGNLGEILDTGGELGDSEIELVGQEAEPRLKLLNTLAALWRMVGERFAPLCTRHVPELHTSPVIEQSREVFDIWQQRAAHHASELQRFADRLFAWKISTPSGDVDSNTEYDQQFQTKLSLLHFVTAVDVSMHAARRCLLCCAPDAGKDVELPDRDRRVLDVTVAIFRGEPTEVRRRLAALLSILPRVPLLYMPFDGGGNPREVRAARTLQETLRFLLARLARMGLLRESALLLKTAYRMERGSRPRGPAITEFDSLFETALRNTLDCVIESATTWRSGRFGDDELIDIIGEVVERYLEIWLRHSQTMRISSVEGLRSDSVWRSVKKFITRYGADLFQGRLLTPGNLRAILHNRIEDFLEYLAENQDPLHPVKLLDDLQSGAVDREEAVAQLQLIYSTIVDKFDHYIEYSTTTTQSDYGEQLHCLLDFLRLEAAYERDSWNLRPVKLAHEQLTTSGKHSAAKIWETVFEGNTSEMADKHLAKLADLERRHGMRLPSLRDRIGERFVKPLAVNRMLSLMPRAIEESRSNDEDPEAFQELRREIESYLETMAGSAAEVPKWIRMMEEHAGRSEGLWEELPMPEKNGVVPVRHISLREMRRQLAIWNEPLGKRQRPN